MQTGQEYSRLALQNEEQPNRVPNENKKKKELNNNK